MRRLWRCAVLVGWLAAGCADDRSLAGGEPVTAVDDLPGGWVEVFEGSFRRQGGSWVFVDQWATMAGLEGRLRHRVLPWPDPRLEWWTGKRFDDDMLVVLEFVDDSGEVVATGDDWATLYAATLDTDGVYRFEMVLGDVPRYSSYRLRVGSQVLVEFAPAVSVPDIEVVEATSPRIEQQPVHDAQPGEPASGRPAAPRIEARPRLVGDIELVVQTPEPQRLVEDFHALVYYSKDGETYHPGSRAPVSSVAAVGPDRLVVTLPRTAIFSPRDPSGAVTLRSAPRAWFLVVFTDGGRWAAAQSPTATLGGAQRPPDFRPRAAGGSDTTFYWSDPDRYAAGDMIRLIADYSGFEEDPGTNCIDDQAASWSSDIDGSLDSLIDAPEGPCAPYLLDASKLTPGDHQLSASVTDHRGLTATVPSGGLLTIEGDPAAAGERIPIIARDDYVPRNDLAWNPVPGRKVCVDVLDNDRAHRGDIDTDSVSVIEHPNYGTAAITDGATCQEHTSCFKVRWCLEYTVADGDGLRAGGDRLTYQVCNTEPQPRCDTADLHIPRPLNIPHGETIQ